LAPVEQESVADGWLQEPGGRNVLRFHRDPESSYWTQYVFIDKGEPIPGQPPLLKTRQRVVRRLATERWHELLKAGWRRVEPQW
jgi:alkylated DNA repair dioxygenase AlkB